jgi:cellulase (glycosyl hydrolase family 5)
MYKLRTKPPRRWLLRTVSVAATLATASMLAACSGTSSSSVPPTSPAGTHAATPAASSPTVSMSARPALSGICPDHVTAAVSAQLAAQQALNTGVSTGDILRSGETTDELNELMLKTVCAGFKWIRLDLEWSTVQPEAGGAPNWQLYNNVAAVAAHWGVSIDYILDSDPGWAVDNTTKCQGAPWTCAPRAPPSAGSPFAKFCAASTQNFKNTASVTWFEVQNEPSGMFGYWNDVKRYAEDYLSCYRAIKQYAPRIKVMTGGTTAAGTTGPIDNTGDGATTATDWYRGMCASGLGSNLDGAGDHPYTYPESPRNVQVGESDSPWGQITLVSRILQQDCGVKVPVELTEMGFPTSGLRLEGGTDPTFIGGEGDQDTTAAYAAVATLQLYESLHAQGIVGQIYWFSLQDNPAADPLGFGLLQTNGQPKAMWYVIVAFNRHGRFLPPPYTGG